MENRNSNTWSVHRLLVLATLKDIKKKQDELEERILALEKRIYLLTGGGLVLSILYHFWSKNPELVQNIAEVVTQYPPS